MEGEAIVGTGPTSSAVGECRAAIRSSGYCRAGELGPLTALSLSLLICVMEIMPRAKVRL